jgi:hypothetical protein
MQIQEAQVRLVQLLCIPAASILVNLGLSWCSMKGILTAENNAACSAECIVCHALGVTGGRTPPPKPCMPSKVWTRQWEAGSSWQLRADTQVATHVEVAGVFGDVQRPHTVQLVNCLVGIGHLQVQAGRQAGSAVTQLQPACLTAVSIMRCDII